MKQVWIQTIPFEKQMAIAALESGADAVVVAEGDSARVKELGVMKTVAPDGDLRPGDDVFSLEIKSKEDEQEAASRHLDKLLVLRMADWTIIPLENLIAQRGGLMVEVRSADEARTAVQALEKGADGVVFVGGDPQEARRVVSIVHAITEELELHPATITDVRPLGMGDRACIDTCTNMAIGQGMLVGNTTEGFFLVHSETIENPYVAARPFRVNAGAVHAYVLMAGGKTTYMSEIKAGDEVLLVRHDGQTECAYVGRCKVERRPLMLVSADLNGQAIHVMLQNAETIRLTSPDGSPISVAVLKPGDQVLACALGGGRHFGMKVDETIREK